MLSPRICVLIPTYNNERTLEKTVRSVLLYTPHILVVDDGSVDSTKQILRQLPDGIKVVSYKKNRGKGYALKQGFREALRNGYEAVITMDSDGQHLAEDLPLLEEVHNRHPKALVVGSRRMANPNMPAKNTFANRFSNFWFCLQTWQHLPDTQSGYRLYPLQAMHGVSPLCHRYEAELELLVRSAWKGIPLLSQPIQVYYPPKEERVSHFRPTADFMRISLLNAFFCIAALVYGYPKMALIQWKNRHKE